VPIVINPELQAYIDPLTPDEHDALERSLLAEGCRDALVLWGEVLVDGHNRYGICQKHGLPFQTVQNPRFQSLEDVHLWMIDQHLGRRSVSDFQRGVLALRKRELIAARRQRAQAAEPAGAGDAAAAASSAAAEPEPKPLTSREDIAKAARLSNSQVVLIEKIQKQAAPEVVAAVKAGTLSINAAAAVATLPEEDQKAAASAGAEELKQAAKRVREAKRKPREEGAAADTAAAGSAEEGAQPSMQALQRRVEELTAENETLRRRVAALEAQLGA
jgi:hypothetical protein